MRAVPRLVSYKTFDNSIKMEKYTYVHVLVLFTMFSRFKETKITFLNNEHYNFFYFYY